MGLLTRQADLPPRGPHLGVEPELLEHRQQDAFVVLGLLQILALFLSEFLVWVQRRAVA
jgi:hypothetical protein